MSIHIGVAEGLPSTPISYKELDEKCLKTYTTFKFFDDVHIHRANAQGPCHASRASFNAKHVILPGLIESERLMNALNNHMLEIEIHDRDLAGDNALPDRKDAFGVASFSKS